MDIKHSKGTECNSGPLVQFSSDQVHNVVYLIVQLTQIILQKNGHIFKMRNNYKFHKL